MRLQEILNIIKDNLLLGIIGVITLGIFLWIGYFVIYKKILRGKRNLSRKKLFIGGLFTCYIIMVLGVTFFNRGAYFERNFNFHLLSSYIEAWNNFGTRNWQFIIFNIVMFVPLGILLPLFHKRFHKFKWTMGVGLLFTLFIECVQAATAFGIFDLDDVFNNTLGTIIGYGIFKGIMSLRKGKEKRFRKAAGYFSPLFIIVVLFAGIFTFYHFQEFGNLSSAPSYRVNMNEVKTTSNIKLSKEGKSLPIYKAPTFTKDSAREFAMDFLKKMKIDKSDVEVITYDDSALYKIGKYNLSLNYVDGSYSFTDFSRFDEGAEPLEANEDFLRNNLRQLGITVPDGATFKKREDASYEWSVDQKISGDQLINGGLSCMAYKDGTIKNINNHIITYKKVRSVPIKSEMEAYQELLDGKFHMFLMDKIKTIEIHGIELEYDLDSKGFYQPVYFFDCKINGMEYPIIIPAM